MARIRFEHNIIPANAEKTLGKLYFSKALDPVVDPDSGEMRDRRYDLMSEGQEDTIMVSVPATESELKANFDDEVKLVNPVFKAWAMFQGGSRSATSDVKITADSIRVVGSPSKPIPTPVNERTMTPKREEKTN